MHQWDAWRVSLFLAAGIVPGYHKNTFKKSSSSQSTISCEVASVAIFGLCAIRAVGIPAGRSRLKFYMPRCPTERFTTLAG
jgi:hypothetical protein